MKKEIANLFWHGELTKFEKTCIESFVKQGFHTKIWSYTNLQIDGAESCDARLVLSEEHITKYKQQQYFAITDEAKQYYSSLAALSDAFRWNVVNNFGGWWFDTDCYCLKSSEEFKKLRGIKPFISGLQTSESPSVACGAFYADQQISTKLVDKLNSLCQTYNYQFPVWGIIGPFLISEVVQRENLLEYILSPDKFYSIESPSINNLSSINYYTDPALKDKGKSLIADSYVTHICHSALFFTNIDKNNPPKNSLLEEFYNNTYVNNLAPDVQTISKYKTSLKRYIQVSLLYKKILNRSGDIDGIKHYVASHLSYDKIENIFKNSQEYINKLNKI
jgi:hypothetical protein